MRARLIPSLSTRARWVFIALFPLSGLAVMLILLKRPPLTEAVCEQIREGMTEEEIVTLLGGPATNYGDDGQMLLLPGKQRGMWFHFGPSWSAEWYDSNWYIYVAFGYDGNPTELPPAEQLRRLVGSGRHPHARSMKAWCVRHGPMPSLTNRVVGFLLKRL
jgi:hypothetical protein